MLVVVLNAWVTETKETPCASNSFDQLGEIRERAGQPVDLVDDDHIDPSFANAIEQTLQRRTIGGAARIAAVVEALAHQSPAFMSLALDISLG